MIHLVLIELFLHARKLPQFSSFSTQVWRNFLTLGENFSSSPLNSTQIKTIWRKSPAQMIFLWMANFLSQFLAATHSWGFKYLSFRYESRFVMCPPCTAPTWAVPDLRYPRHHGLLHQRGQRISRHQKLPFTD